MKKNAQAGFGVVLAIMLGFALSGTVSMISPEASIAPTCIDSINNDGDVLDFGSGITNPIQDYLDPECMWMPFKFGQGEYDGNNVYLTSPQYTVNSADVANYVQTWQNSDQYPTYFQALLAMEAILQTGVNPECYGQVQDAMIEYRDTYGLPDSKTGVSEHQAHCGVSY